LKNFDSIFIVMDFVERDISSLFSRDRPLEFNEEHVMCIFYNILCAMNFLETANILHRDLKPSNILIGDDCRIKICDFGFARTMPKAACTDSNDSRNLSSIETIQDLSSFEEHSKSETDTTSDRKKGRKREMSPHVFTRWYRPPEVILGQQTYDSTADIWSIGCTLAEGIR